MNKANTALWTLIGLLLLALVGVAVYKAWPILYPQVLVRAKVDPDCDLRAGPCISRLPSGAEVGFSIEPRDIPLLTPLQLLVDVTGLEVRQAEVDFSGVDMYMGYNRVKLSPAGAGEYRGEGRIPVCVRDAMEWEASILLYTERGIIDIPYRFITVKPGLVAPDWSQSPATNR